ncbi:MAG: hypothetical protein LBC12_00425 [Nitrososphaerota archaeon]|jgi:hypothetical protein|nr:hypothetical protein [Nitrososphaerota archaeon]
MVVCLRDFLRALCDVGEEVEAVELERKIVEKFKDTSLTREQLYAMDMNVINGVLNMAKIIRRQVSLKPQTSVDTLQLYVRDLQVRGFSVAVNPEYQHLLVSRTG